MPPLPITAVYGALLALLTVLLVLLVVRLRRSLRIGIGDGGNRDLARAIRVHANAIESIPLFLILFAVYEINGGNYLVLHAFGMVYLASRVAHAAGMLRSAGASPARVAGTVGTVFALIGLAVVNLLSITPILTL